MAHRQMLKLANRVPLNEPGLEWSCEVRRHRCFPMCGSSARTHAWGVYVDNLDQAEVFSVSEWQALEGITSSTMRFSEERYDDWGSATIERNELRSTD